MRMDINDKIKFCVINKELTAMRITNTAIMLSSMFIPDNVRKQEKPVTYNEI